MSALATEILDPSLQEIFDRAEHERYGATFLPDSMARREAKLGARFDVVMTTARGHLTSEQYATLRTQYITRLKPDMPLIFTGGDGVQGARAVLVWPHSPFDNEMSKSSQFYWDGVTDVPVETLAEVEQRAAENRTVSLLMFWVDAVGAVRQGKMTTTAYGTPAFTAELNRFLADTAGAVGEHGGPDVERDWFSLNPFSKTGRVEPYRIGIPVLVKKFNSMPAEAWMDEDTRAEHGRLRAIRDNLNVRMSLLSREIIAARTDVLQDDYRRLQLRLRNLDRQIDKTHTHPVLKAWRRLFRDRIRGSVAGRQKKLIAFIHEHSDPTVMKALRRTLEGRPEVYNFYNAEGDETRRRNRLQASEQFPLFTSLFARDAMLARLIDEGVSPALALERRFHVTRLAVRAMKGLAWQRVGSYWISRPAPLLDALDNLSPEQMPRTRQDWKAFGEVEKAFAGIAHATGGSVGRHLRGNLGGGLRSFANVSPVTGGKRQSGDKLKSDPGRSINHSVPITTSEVLRLFSEVTEKAQHVIDCVRDPVRAILYPLAIDLITEKGVPLSIEGVHAVATGRSFRERAVSHHLHSSGVQLESPFFDAVIRGKSFGGLRKIAEDWHGKVSRIQEIKRGYSNGKVTSWLPLFEGKITIGDADGLHAIALTSTAELDSEGKRLSHCVGTYASHCLYNNCHIVSVRDANGQSLSTAELRLTNEMNILRALKEGSQDVPLPAVTIQQHRSFRNGTPTAEANRLIEMLAEDIRTGKLPIDVPAIVEARHARGGVLNGNRGENLFDLIGYDYTFPEARARLFEEYRFMLPREDRELSLEQWLTKHDVREALRENLVGLLATPGKLFRDEEPSAAGMVAVLNVEEGEAEFQGPEMDF